MIADHDLTFDPKDPEEIIPLTFDFSPNVDAPLTPSVSITRHSGSADANPSSMLVGSAQIVGATIVQKVGGGVDLANYTVRCRVNKADGTQWVLSGLLPVQTA